MTCINHNLKSILKIMLFINLIRESTWCCTHWQWNAVCNKNKVLFQLKISLISSPNKTLLRLEINPYLDCHAKSVPPKIGPTGPIFTAKTGPLCQFWSPCLNVNLQKSSYVFGYSYGYTCMRLSIQQVFSDCSSLHVAHNLRLRAHGYTTMWTGHTCIYAYTTKLYSNNKLAIQLHTVAMYGLLAESHIRNYNYYKNLATL